VAESGWGGLKPWEAAMIRRRGILQGLAAILVAGQLGCAARNVQTPPAAPTALVADGDRTTCEAYAQRKAEEPKKPRPTPGDQVAGLASFIIFSPVLLVLAPAAVIMAPVTIRDLANEAKARKAARQARYEAALDECGKPTLLAQT